MSALEELRLLLERRKYPPEMLGAVRAEVLAEAEQPATEAEFTDASTAFMQIGQTPALQGRRAELRIEGYPPIVGSYAGAGMRRLEEGVLAIEPLLLFAWANTATTDEAEEASS